MSTVAQFISLLNQRGSAVRFHRSDSLVPCPCKTPEGFRDMEWHLQNPNAPLCDENGMLPDPNVVDVTVKAFVQPVASTRATRLSAEYAQQLFGDVQSDDHIGIFPESWQGISLDFADWSQSGQDYVEYDGCKYMAVNANLIPDPSDGNPRHHWEVGLRLITSDLIVV